VRDCERATAIDPKYVRGWVRLGQALFALGDDPEKEDMFDLVCLREAESALEKALALDPENKTAAKTVKEVRVSIQLYED
jgi:tetratricopeptide (TPR) repeat protein